MDKKSSYSKNKSQPKLDAQTPSLKSRMQANSVKTIPTSNKGTD